MSNEQFKPGDWMCEHCNNHNFARRAQCHRCGQAKAVAGAAYGGGWGGAVQQGGGGGGGGGAVGGGNRGGGNVAREAGDWDCPSCGNLNFQRRNECHRCQRPRPRDFGYGQQPQRGFDNGYGQEQYGMDQGYGYAQGYGQAYGGGQRMQRVDDWDCWVCGHMKNDGKAAYCEQCKHEKDKCLPKKGKENAKPGDWLCMQCQSVNFRDKVECFNCGADRQQFSNERVLESLCRPHAD